jgi:hypothetical protein
MGLSDAPWPLLASARPWYCGVSRKDGFNEDCSLTPPCSGPERFSPPSIVWALPCNGAGAGLAGVEGVNGMEGVSGVDGVNGMEGVSGVDGVNGMEGVSGVNGAVGVDGVDGT